MTRLTPFLPYIVVAFPITIGIYAASLLPAGTRPVSLIENIHGIPYPERRIENMSVRVITEDLAHADIALQEPVFGKQLVLTITYRPVNLTSLSVGVREDSFWLSYGSRQPVPAARDSVQTETVTIPLTDKLQERDRSIDVMFFAEAPAGQDPQWQLYAIEARTEYDWPTSRELRNYLRSIIKRERAL